MIEINDIHIPEKIGPYQYLKFLNNGRISKHALFQHTINGTIHFFKIFEKSSFTNQIKYLHFIEKIKVISSLECPGLITYDDYFEDSHKIYLVSRYCPKGNIGDMIVTKGRLSENVARSIFRSLVQVLRYLQQNDIAHRDIKVENIVFDANWDVFLTDFDYATKTNDDGFKMSREDNDNDDICGTFLYNAPEIMKVSDEKYDLFKADVWSLGIILYTMVAGQFPYNVNEKMSIKEQIESGRVVMDSSFSPELSDLLSQILNIDPEKRLGVDKIIAHPWLSKRRRNLSYSKSSKPSTSDETIITPKISTIPAPSRKLSILLGMVDTKSSTLSTKKKHLARNQSFNPTFL